MILQPGKLDDRSLGEGLEVSSTGDELDWPQKRRFISFCSHCPVTLRTVSAKKAVRVKIVEHLWRLVLVNGRANGEVSVVTNCQVTKNWVHPMLPDTASSVALTPTSLLFYLISGSPHLRSHPPPPPHPTRQNISIQPNIPHPTSTCHIRYSIPRRLRYQLALPISSHLPLQTTPSSCRVFTSLAITLSPPPENRKFITVITTFITTEHPSCLALIIPTW